MSVKQDDVEHDLKEEAEHSSKKDNNGDLREEIYRNLTGAEKDAQIIDNQVLDTLEQEINSYWANPAFLKLVNDPEFLKMLDEICRRLTSHFKPSRTYSCKDLRQDVIVRFVRWLPNYRRDASCKTVLETIARNQLVNVYRSRDEQCPSLEDLELGDCRMAASQNVQAVSGNILVKESLYSTIQKAVTDIEVNIIAEELSSKLSNEKDRQLFDDYFIEGKTVQEIARERKVSRQAVAKRLSRVAKKLRPYVS